MVRTPEIAPRDQGTWVWLPDATSSASLIPELVADLRKGGRRIGVTLFGAAVLMYVVTFFLPIQYESTAVVSIVEEQPSSALTDVAGQLGGLAGLAGVTLPLATGDKNVVVLATLKSRAFLVDFARRHRLVETLFRKRFNAQTGEWKQRLFGGDDPPSEEEIAERMFERFRADKDTDTGLIEIVVAGDSAASGRDWNQWLIRDLNEKLRRHDIEESERAIEYLNRQIALTTVTELRNVYYRLIEARMKSAVLAHVSAEYAVRIVDPPSLADRPSGPKRFLLATLAGVAAALVVILIILLRFALRPRGSVPLAHA